MAPPTLTVILDNVGSSTLEARLPGLIDNVYDSNPIAARMLQRDNINLEGGRDIRSRLIYAKKNSGWYGSGDTFNTDAVETRTEMVFDWKRLYINITIDGLSLMKNAGSAQVSDLVQDEMDEADLTGGDTLGTAMFNDGTDSNALTGLRAIVDDGNLVATYGGITRGSTANTPGNAVNGNVTTTGVTFSLTQMNTLFQDAVIAHEKPDLIVTTQAIYNKWWERAQPSQRFGPNDENRPVKIGFSQIEFNGAAVVVDSHCPTASVYFLNTKWIKLIIHTMRNFAPTGWKYPTNSDQAIQQILLGCELVCRSPRLQSLGTNVT